MILSVVLWCYSDSRFVDCKVRYIEGKCYRIYRNVRIVIGVGKLLFLLGCRLLGKIYWY